VLLSLKRPRPCIAAVFLSLWAAFMGGCGSDPKVARVDDDAITMKEFERQLRILKSLRPDTKADDITRRQVLEQMVKQQLLSDEAKKAGLDKDPSVLEAIQSQREAVRQELMDNIKNAQAQLEQLDRAVEQKVLIEAFLNSRKSAISVSEAELKKAYEERARQSGPTPLPPMIQLRDQLLQQVQLEKLVDQAKPHYTIELYPEVAAQGKLD
jgi:hypothetical protein